MKNPEQRRRAELTESRVRGRLRQGVARAGSRRCGEGRPREPSVKRQLELGRTGRKRSGAWARREAEDFRGDVLGGDEREDTSAAAAGAVEDGAAEQLGPIESGPHGMIPRHRTRGGQIQLRRNGRLRLRVGAGGFRTLKVIERLPEKAPAPRPRCPRVSRHRC